MKLQTIDHIHRLLQDDAASKRKYAKDKREGFRKALESREHECANYARMGVSPPPTLIYPPEGEAVKAEQDAAAAEDALQDFLDTDWRC